MNRGEQLKDLSHVVNSILDWGCVDRKTSVQATLAKIEAKNDSMPAASSEGGKESATEESWEHVSQASGASRA